MLVRNVPSAYVLAILVTVSLFVIWNYTYGASRTLELVPQLLDHDKPLSPPKGDKQRPIERPETIAKFFEWGSRSEDFPLEANAVIPLPNGTLAEIPAIQFKFEPSTDENYNNKIRDRRHVVKDVMIRCWTGYKNFAWMYDELAVTSGEGRDRYGGWGATLVDAMDTLWIMDMTAEFDEAVAALETLDFTSSTDNKINTFEATVHYLGGLLSTHDLTEGKYPILLEKAVELGNMLYASFDTRSRMPIMNWEWRGARDGTNPKTSEPTLLLQMGSLSLEFTRLSQVTGNPKYYDAIQRVSNAFEMWQNVTRLPGLWPLAEDTKDRHAHERDFTISSTLDSTYEYLPKQYMLLGGQSQQPKKMYENAIEAAKIHIFYRPMNKQKSDVLLAGLARAESATRMKFEAETQHRACYIGAMMGIGSQIFDRKDDLLTAKRLLDGCLWAHDNVPLGLMPETFRTIPCTNSTDCEWDNKLWLNDILNRHEDKGINPENLDWKVLEYGLSPGFSDVSDRRYILRAETIETVFTLYRITGDEDLRERAWQLFDKIEKVTKNRYGSAAIDDVTTYPWPEHADSMDTRWMAKTLKYFYLCFNDPSLLSLDEWVFNTMGHPFQRPTPAVEAQEGKKMPKEGGSGGL